VKGFKISNSERRELRREKDEAEETPKKLRGCVAASPRFTSKLSEECYLFFFLAFFFAAILFSSRLRDFAPAETGGARTQSPCIVTARTLVKRKVNVKNNLAPTAALKKSDSRPDERRKREFDAANRICI
jgi:hypothetical protein